MIHIDETIKTPLKEVSGTLALEDIASYQS